MGTTRSLGEGRFTDLKRTTTKKEIRKTDLDANKSCIEVIVLYLYQKLGNKLDHIRRIRKKKFRPQTPITDSPLPVMLKWSAPQLLLQTFRFEDENDYEYEI